MTYGETVQPSVTSTTNEGATVTYSYAGTGDTSYGPSNEAPENAGTYTVTATAAETGHPHRSHQRGYDLLPSARQASMHRKTSA